MKNLLAQYETLKRQPRIKVRLMADVLPAHYFIQVYNNQLDDWFTFANVNPSQRRYQLSARRTENRANKTFLKICKQIEKGTIEFEPFDKENSKIYDKNGKYSKIN